MKFTWSITYGKTNLSSEFQLNFDEDELENQEMFKEKS